MPGPASTEIAAQIQDLYGAPLADLAVRAQQQPPGMLAALLGMHEDLVLAERSITVHRDRLAQRLSPGRQLGRHEVSHLLDDARRLAEAVAVRDVQAKSATAVLHSLARVPAPDPSCVPGPPAATPPVPAACTAAVSTARSR
ncbi:MULTISPECIES: hypothetical protein [unclassified Streptomyces]|uniref:hypothetical protein n=1 Tax=unclassified Streptomyces TaxID=2593676 RepID=UPI00363144FD